MQVQVEDGLPGRFVAIHHHAIAIVSETFGRRNFLRSNEQVADLLPIAVFYVIDSCYMSAGDDQDMRRCLWIDVPESESVCRLVNHVGRYIARQDFAEKAIGHVLPPSLTARRP